MADSVDLPAFEQWPKIVSENCIVYSHAAKDDFREKFRPEDIVRVQEARSPAGQDCGVNRVALFSIKDGYVAWDSGGRIMDLKRTLVLRLVYSSCRPD